MCYVNVVKHINLLQLFKQSLHLVRLISYSGFQFLELGTPYAISATECKAGFLIEYTVLGYYYVLIFLFQVYEVSETISA